MDITLIGRNVGITDRFREYTLEKSDRVTHLAERALSLEIRLCRHHETNGTTGDDRVELTLISPGPIVRAEAGGADKYAAFDAALSKLLEQIRRAKDRRKIHRGHGNRLTSLREASATEFASLDVQPADGDAMRWASTAPQQLATEPEDDEPAEHDAYSPIEIRRKVFSATPMTVDDALYRMELVGHDFYLYIDAETHRPSAVYRRGKGWSYGVLELDVQERGDVEVRPEEERETVSTR